MTTNKQNTQSVIVSTFGRSTSNTVLNTLDIEHFQHNCRLELLNNEPLYELLNNKRIKALSLAKNTICTLINKLLKLDGCKTVCTYKQIKDIFNEYNTSVSLVENYLIELIEEEREELFN